MEREREGVRFGGSRIRARALPPPHTRTYARVARTCTCIAPSVSPDNRSPWLVRSHAGKGNTMRELTSKRLKSIKNETWFTPAGVEINNAQVELG